MFGITPHQSEHLQQFFAQYSVPRVLIYGSRALGMEHNYSDIDLAVDAPEWTDSEWQKMRMAFEELPLIYKTDLVRLQAISNEKFRAKILRDGKVFYSSSSA